MNWKVFLLVVLLVIAVLLVACREQVGEAGKKLASTKQPVGGAKAPATGTAGTESGSAKTPATSCRASTSSSCVGSSIVTVETAADCTTRELSRFDCSPGNCTVSTGTPLCTR
jgi:hypothetical protein